MHLNMQQSRPPEMADSPHLVLTATAGVETDRRIGGRPNYTANQEVHLPSVVERRSASSRFSMDAWAALGRHISVLARRIPASAAPTAPRPNDHIPISNIPPSSPDAVDDTAATTWGEIRVICFTQNKRSTFFSSTIPLLVVLTLPVDSVTVALSFTLSSYTRRPRDQQDPACRCCLAFECSVYQQDSYHFTHVKLICDLK